MVSRILIVEDNEVNRVLLEDILALGRYEVLKAADGKEGIRMAREQQPHLIFMDIELPGMDGISATRVLKNDPMTRHIPVVAISSYAYEREKQLFQAAGGDAYLTKPIDVDVVLQTAAKFLEGEG